MSDSLSLNRIPSFTVGATSAASEPVPAADNPCLGPDKPGHAWQRDPIEAGNSGALNIKDRHFTCGRYGCGWSLVEHYADGRWLRREIAPGAPKA